MPRDIDGPGVPMELCMLPNTGADAGVWAFAIVAAVVAIALGVVMLGRGATRRRMAMGMAALAAVGVVALGSMGAAPSAIADSGSRDCVTQTPAPAPSQSAAPTAAPSPSPSTPPAATPVTPIAPALQQRCELESAVTIPTQTGVAYAESRTGTVLTVTASATAGYVIATGAQTVFTFDVAPSVPAPPVSLPAQVDATWVSSFGGVRAAAADPALVPALADAEAAGQLGYVIESRADGLSFDFEITDPETGDVVATRTVPVPFETTVVYDFETNEYVYDFSFFELIPVVDSIFRQLQVEFPGFIVENVGLSDPLAAAIVVSYEGGPACGTLVVEAPIVVDSGGPGEGSAPAGVLDAALDAFAATE